MDKGYDSAAVRNMVENVFGYIPHVRTRGEKKKIQTQPPTACSTMGGGADS
jgi:hypothetical protein